MIKQAKVVGPNVSYEVYSRQADGVTRGHKDYSLSRSALAEILVNPKRWRDGVDEDNFTDATNWGSLIDVLAMTPERFDELYAVAPAEYEDEKTGKMKKWNANANVCKEWEAEQGNKEVLKSKMLDKAKQAITALNADADVSELFNCSAKQVFCIAEWHDKTGVVVPVRCLIDLVPDVKHERFRKWLCDFKTARNGNPDMWARVVDDCAYDIQAALSMDTYIKATGEDRTDWTFPLQENVHPYHVVKPMPALTMEFLAYGRSKYEAALKIYCQCVASGVWPSYSTRDRLVMNPVQLIGPDTLWSYRQQAGLGGRMSDFSTAPATQPNDGELPP